MLLLVRPEGRAVEAAVQVHGRHQGQVDQRRHADDLERLPGTAGRFQLVQRPNLRPPIKQNRFYFQT